MALFLASEESNYINRSTLAADGGMTTHHPVGLIDLIAGMMKEKGS